MLCVATTTVVLCLGGTGGHEDCRPGKEQQAAERECFAKHGVPPLLMLGMSGYIVTLVPDDRTVPSTWKVIRSIAHALAYPL